MGVIQNVTSFCGQDLSIQSQAVQSKTLQKIAAKLRLRPLMFLGRPCAQGPRDFAEALAKICATL